MFGLDKTETKTRVAGVVTFAGTLAATALLQSLDLTGLPQYAAPVAAALVTSALTWLAAYRARHTADALSMSAIIAAGKRARRDDRAAG